MKSPTASRLLTTTVSAFFAFSLMFSLNGCGDRLINPFEDENGLYSIYGSLSLSDSVHYIRVRKLDVPLLADSTVSHDATVTFTDLETGESSVLQDTIVNFEGNFTSNFRLNQILQHDRQYEIVVQRSDGNRARSIVSTPKVTELEMIPRFGVPVEQIQCESSIDFYFHNVRFPEFIMMQVTVEYGGQLHTADVAIVGRLRHMPNDVMHVRMSPRNLLVEVFPPPLPDNPFFNMYLLFPTVRCNELDTNLMRIRYFHMGAEWAKARPHTGPSSGNNIPYAGPLDVDSGDVENGIGFIGAFSVGETQFVIN